jgi:hypothetical protein
VIKLKHILTEKKDLAPNIIADLAKMTDRNNHNEARRDLASHMNNLKYQHIYQSIIMIQNKEGHMPRNLIKYRDDVDKQFFSLVKRKYGNYNDINSAF